MALICQSRNVELGWVEALVPGGDVRPFVPQELELDDPAG